MYEPVSPWYSPKGYYIIWIEGLNYFDGEKIEGFYINKVNAMDVRPIDAEYTDKMTTALRVKGSMIFEVKELLDELGILVKYEDFIKTDYAPSGTLLKRERLNQLKANI